MVGHCVVVCLLFVGILIYFRIADTFNIIDKPNQRSSHNYITIRGGGVVYWLAGLLFAVMHWPESACFLTGLTLISGVSLWDDISSLPNRVRIVVHFLSISLVFYGLGLFVLLPWWTVVVAYVFFVGVLNAYNFMDGINGITGWYSLAVLVSLQYVNMHRISFTEPDFINYAILASLVFLFFNYRKRARCFAGDVGSMAISFWIVTLLLQLMVQTGSVVWILFLAVYGVDSIYTILHRLYLRQNIFEAHRLHFYQILVNERGWSHLVVSPLYAVVQLGICGVVIATHGIGVVWGVLIYMIVLGGLSGVYVLKFRRNVKPRSLRSSHTPCPLSRGESQAASSGF